MTKNEMLLALDRISRFKFPEKKLKRVYVETICKNFIAQKIKKSELEKYDNRSLKTLFEEIWNYSVLFNFDEVSKDFSLNKNFLNEEKKCFYLNREILDLYPNKADFCTVIKRTKQNPNNFLNYKTPQKLVLTEGVTEEILLPEFSKIYGYDWIENNVVIESIGGKSRIIDKYDTYKEQLKIPIFILLDNDAKPVYEKINKSLRKSDKSHLIQSGEIEDIIPIQIFKTAINTEYKIQTKISLSDFDKNVGNVENLHNIFKEKNLGEFKKAKMALFVKNILKKDAKLSDELIKVLEEIKSL